MKIQINHDAHVRPNEDSALQIEAAVRLALSHFAQHVTDVEVHLSDENGSGVGQNDKRCLIEARLAGHQPIAVSEHGATVDEAMHGACAKLKQSVAKLVERSRDH
ncbi:MAG: HPF/RaiA family ribosome-associated protein [Polyangiaceae bacterium]